jgi:hypothetical protein
VALASTLGKVVSCRARDQTVRAAGFFLGRALADGLVGDRRPIIISLLPGDVIAFREYRRRQVFSLPIDYVFKCAVTSTARAAKSKPKR